MPLPIQDAEAVVLVLPQPRPQLGSQLGLLGRPQQAGRITICAREQPADPFLHTTFIRSDLGDRPMRVER